ncbi:DUF4259 domain-containing protein [Solirubrobacter phytolaccae]|uniref:DUF4259 domain-containing protein n=1 Tax=Solirubrobacter phytolaccae TaxID=1404360 RepID=A0A9X3NFJ3_9ACTN|nr:DUF4259 domain-containing protein [Solirubrobacter phytolaccae]MDA0184072.1 DUF4259 domain-containing protein [Solirubrobacter phytolaccae]
MELWSGEALDNQYATDFLSGLSGDPDEDEPHEDPIGFIRETLQGGLGPGPVDYEPGARALAAVAVLVAWIEQPDQDADPLYDDDWYQRGVRAAEPASRDRQLVRTALAVVEQAMTPQTGMLRFMEGAQPGTSLTGGDFHTDMAAELERFKTLLHRAAADTSR